MELTRRQVLRALGASGLLAGAGLGSYGFAYERHRITLTRMVVPVSSLPPALAGLRVGVLSDIHYGRFMPPEDVAAAAALLRAEGPDLIVLAGDFVTWSDRASVGPCAAALSPLAAPSGVFAVAGNHDPEPTLNAVFESRGIQVLRDEHVRLTIRGERVDLGGVRYWSTRTADLQRTFLRSDGFPILLAHDPRRLTQASELGIPLVLSGHTHGGQVVLPGIGAPAAARFPVVAGLGRRRRTTVFVSRGLGTVVLPVRLNCPPEVALLRLERG
jgi:uncharacterized protein